MSKMDISTFRWGSNTGLGVVFRPLNLWYAIKKESQVRSIMVVHGRWKRQAPIHANMSDSSTFDSMIFPSFLLKKLHVPIPHHRLHRPAVFSAKRFFSSTPRLSHLLFHPLSLSLSLSLCRGTGDDKNPLMHMQLFPHHMSPVRNRISHLCQCQCMYGIWLTSYLAGLGFYF